MFDVIKTYEKVPDEIVERYAVLEESASINESMPNKDGALSSRIKAVWPGIRMCGTAMTVQCGIGDNVMLHKAISMAGPGDVLMVTNGDFDEGGGMFGGMMAASLKSRGAAGLVIEVACRDTVLIRKLEFPVFSRNVCIKATTKLCPGRINHPIVIGGVLVNPGDLVFGDDDICVKEDVEGLKGHIRWLVPTAQKNSMEPILVEMAATMVVGLCRLPISFCTISTGRTPPCSEPTTGERSA